MQLVWDVSWLAEQFDYRVMCSMLSKMAQQHECVNVSMIVCTRCISCGIGENLVKNFDQIGDYLFLLFYGSIHILAFVRAVIALSGY